MFKFHDYFPVEFKLKFASSQQSIFMKQFIKNTLKMFPYAFPIAMYLLRKYQQVSFPLKYNSAQDTFSDIYRKNSWGDSDSVSGPGSNIEETKTIRKEFPDLLKELNVCSVLDIPCGDFHWMKEVNIEGVEYLGADIVPNIIESNKKYEDNNIRFELLDIIKDSLPKVDLIFVRDCLVHLSFDDMFKSLQNICNSGSRYLITTTFDKRSKNYNIATGQWRPLNLQIAPFNFPEPLRIINENHPEEEWRDKSLGLWRIADIKETLTRHQIV